MARPKTHGAPWSEEDNAVLRRCVGVWDYGMIAGSMNRSRQAVARQISRLQIAPRGRRPNDDASEAFKPGPLPPVYLR